MQTLHRLVDRLYDGRAMTATAVRSSTTASK
jgi:hypothetical protein